MQMARQYLPGVGVWPAMARSGVAPVRRGVASVGGEDLRRLVRGFDASDLLPQAEAYLDLLVCI